MKYRILLQIAIMALGWLAAGVCDGYLNWENGDIVMAISILGAVFLKVPRSNDSKK